jgi:hypothetical protein
MRKMEKTKSLYGKKSIFLFLFLFSLNFIIAAPPVTQIQNFEDGYVIEASPIETLGQNEDYLLNFFVYHIANGTRVDNSSTLCSMYLVDNSGDLLFESNVLYNGEYWNISIAGGNFSEIDILPYGIFCNSSYLGGSKVGYFEVTPSGVSGTENIVFFLVVLILLYGLTLLFFFKRDVELAPFVILSGMALGVFGLYMIRNGLIIYRDWFSNYLAYVTMGVGFGLSLWALIAWIEDSMK